MSWQHTLARHVSRFAGDDARVAELRDHLAQQEAHGGTVALTDVGSLGVLVGRRAVTRLVVDLPWIGVAALMTLPYLLLLGHSYETHFFAWDMTSGDRQLAASAQSWSRTIDWLTIAGLIAALIAVRRAIEHLRQGRVGGPIALVVGFVVAASQSDLFIERTPWFRDGGLRAEHADEVPFYSVGLYAGFAAIPVVFLLWDVASRRGRPARNRRSVELERGLLEPRALAAVGSILLVVFQPLLASLAMVGFVWASDVFGRTLKLVATVAVTMPVVILVGYGIATDVDDPPVAFVAALVITAAVWVRLAYVAFRPAFRGRTIERTG